MANSLKSLSAVVIDIHTGEAMYVPDDFLASDLNTEKQKLPARVHNLKLARAIFTTASAAAAIAAIGFYAVAWQFGWSIPFAIACTAVNIL